MKRENFIRVHALDDNPLHRHVLELVCADLPWMALKTSSAFSGLLGSPPDLVLINLNHQTCCNRHLIGLTQVSFPDVPIIGYLNSFDPDTLGLISATYPHSMILMTYQEILLQLREYIRLVQLGESLYERTTSRSKKAGFDLLGFMRLSPKEKDVFCLMGKGLGTPEIAGELNCSPRTIETHQRKIGHKLKVSGQFEIRRLALRLMQNDSCNVLSKSDGHNCTFINKSIGHCPYLKAQ